MIFVDTWAWLALACLKDPYHGIALAQHRLFQKQHRAYATSDFVIAEFIWVEPVTRSPAPKGRNRSAQGTALGRGRLKEPRSPERAKHPAGQIIVAPFQGLVSFALPDPRAMPWAGLFQPFRLKSLFTKSPTSPLSISPRWWSCKTSA